MILSSLHHRHWDLLLLIKVTSTINRGGKSTRPGVALSCAGNDKLSKQLTHTDLMVGYVDIWQRQVVGIIMPEETRDEQASVSLSMWMRTWQTCHMEM